MDFLRRQRWSPYLVGALIGVLSWFSFLTADRPLGVSTAVAKTAGMAASVVASPHIARNAYFSKMTPGLDWEWMLVAGLALGAFVSSRLSGDKPAGPPDCPFSPRFAALFRHRYLVAFLGGLILMYGARLAGGCTSGHGISGSLQLALSGWVFFASVFAAGLATAFLLFRPESARG